MEKWQSISALVLWTSNTETITAITVGRNNLNPTVLYLLMLKGREVLDLSVSMVHSYFKVICIDIKVTSLVIPTHSTGLKFDMWILLYYVSTNIFDKKFHFEWNGYQLNFIAEIYSKLSHLPYFSLLMYLLVLRIYIKDTIIECFNSVSFLQELEIETQVSVLKLFVQLFSIRYLTVSL